MAYWRNVNSIGDGGVRPESMGDYIYIADSGIPDVAPNFYSLRVYSRALTADEIAHNYAIDKERFNLP